MNVKLLFACYLLAILALTSCQKSYERPDIVLPGTPANGGGTSGTLLTKMVVQSGGATSTYTFAYDASNQLITVAMNSQVSGQVIVYGWQFTRDNTGKVTQFTLKNNIPGYPVNGVTYTAHYPAGSLLFDYLRADYSFQGMATQDSTLFTISNGKVTKATSYGNYGNSGYYAHTVSNYVYDGTGNNISSEETFEDDGSGLKKVEKNEYLFDDKANALQLGQEAFILGAVRFFSKNNFTKQTNTDYSTTPSFTSTASYLFQYTAAGKPTSSVAKDVSSGVTLATFTYTY